MLKASRQQQNVVLKTVPQMTFSRSINLTARYVLFVDFNRAYPGESRYMSNSVVLIIIQRTTNFMAFSRNAKHFSGLTTIPLETLGDSISSAVLVSWEKNEGDQVNEDDVIAVVETDKVTMDIRAKQTGVFSGGFCAEGDEVSTIQQFNFIN